MTGDQIEREIRDFIDGTGHSIEIVKGKNHKHVYIDGKMVGVICRNGGKRRDSKQIIAKIRQHLKMVRT